VPSLGRRPAPAAAGPVGGGLGAVLAAGRAELPAAVTGGVEVDPVAGLGAAHAQPAGVPGPQSHRQPGRDTRGPPDTETVVGAVEVEAPGAVVVRVELGPGAGLDEELVGEPRGAGEVAAVDRLDHPAGDGHSLRDPTGVGGADGPRVQHVATPAEHVADRRTESVVVRGMCPDIRIMDFRIISDTIEDTEFAVIGALQLVRYLNSHNQYIVVHGVNLSLSIPHVVESFGCGRTPVCDECDRLVGAGVTVVAAAGNNGYQKFLTERGTYPGYATLSITDPGNAEAVITVGATHRRDPHTYGVSYFSSRGPTGDGRMKPDLVAPGERIESILPNDEIGSLDGTSQAAPHASAAAAMLMARYPELNRQPRRIKQILCDSATDLGRERAFQGHGLLDILRALQSF